MSTLTTRSETTVLEQILVDLEAAQNRMDDAAMVAIMAEKVVAHIDAHPVIQGKAALQEAFQAMWPAFVSFKITGSTTVVSESRDLAWQHGTYVQELDLPESGRTAVPGKWMTTFEKIAGEWKVTALAFSAIREVAQS